MRVTINAPRCEGHGMCEDVAAGVFTVDADGMVQLVHDPVPDSLRREAAAGVRACPVAALTLVEE